MILNEEQIEKQSEEHNDKFATELKSRLEQQQSEIEFLRSKLSEAHQNNKQMQQIIQQMEQDSAEAQQRSDTIILQLTRQSEQQNMLLEDMRNRPSFWQRLKTGLFRFTTPSAPEQNVTEQRN